MTHIKPTCPRRQRLFDRLGRIDLEAQNLKGLNNKGSHQGSLCVGRDGEHLNPREKTLQETAGSQVLQTRLDVFLAQEFDLIGALPGDPFASDHQFQNGFALGTQFVFHDLLTKEEDHDGFAHNVQ